MFVFCSTERWTRKWTCVLVKRNFMWWWPPLKKNIGIFLFEKCFCSLVLAHCVSTWLLLSQAVSKHIVHHTIKQYSDSELMSADVSTRLTWPLWIPRAVPWSQRTAYYNLMTLEKAESWLVHLKWDNHLAELIPSSKRLFHLSITSVGTDGRFSVMRCLVGHIVQDVCTLLSYRQVENDNRCTGASRYSTLFWNVS